MHTIATQSHRLPSFQIACDFQTSLLDPDAVDTSVNLTKAETIENNTDFLTVALPTVGINAFHCNVLICFIPWVPQKG